MAEPKLRFPARKLAVLRPGYLALLFVVLALVLGAFALYGLRQSQQSTLAVLERGARSLAEAVSRAEENVLRAEGDMEELVEERLLDNARLLAELGPAPAFSDTLLERLAADNALDQVDVFDAAGRLVASSGVVDAAALAEWRRALAPLLAGADEALLFELDDQLFAVAVSVRGGGAVIVRAAAERIRSGAGRLIQEIGANPDIVYMALQDRLGLLAASHDLVLLESITGDAFLETALTRNAAASRLVEFEGEEIFEVVIPFAPQGTTLGLLRIGLSLDELRAQKQRGRLQVALLVLLLLILGAVGTGAVIVRQNLALLSDAYANIQTYSSRILAQMTDAVVATDPAGAIEVFNQAAEALFGVEGAQVRGQNLREVWPHEAVDRALAGEELVGLAWSLGRCSGPRAGLVAVERTGVQGQRRGGDHRLGDSRSKREGGHGGRSPAARPLGLYGGAGLGRGPRGTQPPQRHQRNRAAAAARVYAAHRRGRIPPANPSRRRRGRAGQSHHRAVPSADAPARACKDVRRSSVDFGASGRDG